MYRWAKVRDPPERSPGGVLTRALERIATESELEALRAELVRKTEARRRRARQVARLVQGDLFPQDLPRGPATREPRQEVAF